MKNKINESITIEKALKVSSKDLAKKLILLTVEENAKKLVTKTLKYDNIIKS